MPCTPGVLVACWCTPGVHLYLTLHTRNLALHTAPHCQMGCAHGRSSPFLPSFPDWPWQVSLLISHHMKKICVLIASCLQRTRAACGRRPQRPRLCRPLMPVYTGNPLHSTPSNNNPRYILVYAGICWYTRVYAAIRRYMPVMP